MKRISTYTFLLGLTFLLLGQELHAQKLTAVVRKSQVGVNERFRISFQLENIDAKSISYPKFNNFKIAFGPSMSQQMSYQNLNGKLSQSVTISYTFDLVAPKKGNFTIGAATVVDQKGKTHKSKPIVMKVVDAPNGAAAAAGGVDNVSRKKAIDAELKQLIFLRAFVSKKKLYQGDQFVITYKLFHAPEIAGRLNNLELDEAPGYEGFWAEKVDLKNVQRTLEVVNGRRFYVSVLKQDILIPQKAGKLKIDPLTVSMTVPVSKPRRQRRRDPFDPFADLDDLFQSPFGRHENHKFYARNTPISINVDPLPGGKPASYIGLVGKLNLEVSLDKDSTEAGDAVTLSVKYSGEGNLPKIQAPNLTFPADFEVYPPKVKERVSRGGGKLAGTKAFDYLIIPRIPGSYEIPKVELAYFDTKSKKYKTLSQDRIPLWVGGEAPTNMSSSGGIAVNKEDIELLGQDIRHIKTSYAGFQEKDVEFSGSGMFWTLLVAPVLLFFGLLFWKQKYDEQKADVIGTRSRRASKFAQRRLAQAKKFMDQGEQRSFFDAVSKGIWGYLGDKLSLGLSDLSRNQVSGILQDAGVGPEPIDELTNLLDHCEMALFAPVSNEGGMQATYDRALSLIENLDKEIKAVKA